MSLFGRVLAPYSDIKFGPAEVFFSVGLMMMLVFQSLVRISTEGLLSFFCSMTTTSLLGLDWDSVRWSDSALSVSELVTLFPVLWIWKSNEPYRNKKSKDYFNIFYAYIYFSYDITHKWHIFGIIQSSLRNLQEGGNRKADT